MSNPWILLGRGMRPLQNLNLCAAKGKNCLSFQSDIYCASERFRTNEVLWTGEFIAVRQDNGYKAHRSMDDKETWVMKNSNSTFPNGLHVIRTTYLCYSCWSLVASLDGTTIAVRCGEPNHEGFQICSRIENISWLGSIETNLYYSKKENLYTCPIFTK